MLEFITKFVIGSFKNNRKRKRCEGKSKTQTIRSRKGGKKDLNLNLIKRERGVSQSYYIFSKTPKSQEPPLSFYLLPRFGL